MKIDITIKDATVEQATEIMAKIHGRIELEVTTGLGHDTGPLQVAQKLEPKQDVDDGQVDSEGFPWDERIHSGNKKKKADGTWHRKKGCEDELWESVRQELRAAKAPAMPTNGESDEQSTTEQVAHTQAPIAAAPPMPLAAPTQQTMPPMPTTPNTEVSLPQSGDFNSLLTKIQQGMVSGNMNPEYINSIMARLNTQFNVQLNAITDIMQNQPMIDAAFAFMAQDGK